MNNDQSPPPANQAELDALRSVYTTNLPGILAHFDISLAVSTYQAGRVILVRNDNGAINTHFRNFHKPMGIAADLTRLTVGGSNTVWTFRNMPAVARKLEPPGRYDACYLPRQIHVTGDIDIHEMAYTREGELWLVNTRFCCLCTLDPDHSFTPRWRPPFVSALAPEDRCHLNGLAMVEGRPRFVTALGETDTPGGWRENKKDGGILMDVQSNKVLLRGLSMPHSPRLYAGRLWLLESGEGALAWADVPAGTWHTVCQLPGFTRGITFAGPLAFIGLSQVRETAVFSGIPLVERLEERTCGVWVVNIQTGQTVAFLRFEEGVQEIFAVQVLPARFPDVLEFGDERINNSYVIPDAALAEVPPERRDPVEPLRPPPQPGTFEAVFQEGLELLEAEQLDEAIVKLRQAAALDPKRAEVFNNLGNAFTYQNRLHEAIAEYEKALALNPELADAHMNLGMALLKLGQYERGFPEFDWRWQTRQFTPFYCPQPKWDGSPAPAGQVSTILVHTEQGAGDSIQFIRFVPEVARRGWRVLLAAPEHLQALFKDIEGVSEIVGAGSIPLQAFQVYAPLVSLPTILGATLETVRAGIPYVRVPAGRSIALPQPEPGSLKVGIVWAGSPTQGNDHNRSASLAAFAPLLQTPGATFYSLQVGEKAAELAHWQGQFPIHDLAPQLRDWADTAAAVNQLDLVISVDTGVAHLAGALAKPVWVLLCFAPDWRWMLERADSPWYPTVRLFRQQQPKDWAPVVEEVKQALAALAR